MPKIESEFGLLDVLVNNAGIYRFGKVESASDELLESLMQVNIRGVVLGAQFAIAQMKRRSPDLPWASMIHLSSIAGLVGSPTSSLYSMTKGAVRLFSKSLALEMAQLGYRIRSNSVHPGIIDTDMAGGGGWLAKSPRRFHPRDLTRIRFANTCVRGTRWQEWARPTKSPEAYAFWHLMIQLL